MTTQTDVGLKLVEVTPETIPLHIDMDLLETGDLADLESATTATKVIEWCQVHAGVDPAVLRHLKLRALRKLVARIGDIIKAGLDDSPKEI